MKRKRGFTLIELLTVMAIIALLVGLLLPALASSRGKTLTLKDQAQLKQIHAGWVAFSRDFDGVLPTPGLINRVTSPGESALGRGPEDLEANTSGAMYSACIAQQYFMPQILLSPTEAGPSVAVKDDYDWSLYSPIEDVYWDADAAGNPPPNALPGYVPFAANLSSDNPHAGSPICNTSYAHTPICGERKVNEWRDSMNSKWAVIGNRGVICGDDRNKQVYEASVTLEFHGGRKQWVGNIGFNDNHVVLHRTFYPDGMNFLDSNNLTVPDNLFRNDSENGDCESGRGVDVFLALVSRIDDGEACTITTEWD